MIRVVLSSPFRIICDNVSLCQCIYFVLLLLLPLKYFFGVEVSGLLLNLLLLFICSRAVYPALCHFSVPLGTPKTPTGSLDLWLALQTCGVLVGPEDPWFVLQTSDWPSRPLAITVSVATWPTLRITMSYTANNLQ